MGKYVFELKDSTDGTYVYNHKVELDDESTGVEVVRGFVALCKAATFANTTIIDALRTVAKEMEDEEK